MRIVGLLLFTWTAAHGATDSLKNETATACPLTLTPSISGITSAGGSSTISVVAPNACSWNIASSASWLLVNPGHGTGNAVVTLTAGMNVSGSARTANLMANGMVLSITQSFSPMPSIVSVSPVFGSGSNPSFTAVYSDTGGANNLNHLRLLINSSTGLVNACLIQVDPAGIHLADDTGTFMMGPLQPGGSLSNRQCSLNGSGTGLVSSGNSSTLAANVTFNGSFSGLKTIYLMADDLTGSTTNWQMHGSFIVAPAPAPRQVHLRCGDDLQGAINTAVGPTVITVAHLQSDGITRCQWKSYALPWRPDNDIVTIQTDAQLPASGIRTKPGDNYLALFVDTTASSGNYSVFYTSPQTTINHPIHGYTFKGLEMTTPNDQSHVAWGIVDILPYAINTYVGTNDLPYSIDVEHCYIHGGNADQEIGRGIVMGGYQLRVEDSVISDIHSTFIESNAIWGCDTYGNWVIENNELVAAGENFLTCGSGETVHNLPSASNLTFRYNYVHKPLSWRTYITHNGAPYIMKNLFELKSWNGALIDSNLFEYSWQQSQGGYGILFTPRTDFATINHTVSHVTFQNNTVRHVASGISMSFYDGTAVATGFCSLQQCILAGGGSDHMTFYNNLVDDISGPSWGFGAPSYGMLMGVVTGPGAVRNYSQNLSVDHNTFTFDPADNINSAGVMYSVSGPWFTGSASDSVMTYNIFGWEMVRAGGTGPGAVLTGSNFSHNSIGVSFTNQTGWDLAFPNARILSNSTASPDGRGANISQLSSLETLVRAGARPN